MKGDDVVLRTVTKLAIFILLTFGFYVFLADHNNPGGGSMGSLISNSAFVLMFLALNVEEVLESLPIDFGILMTIGTLVPSTTAIIPAFFGKPFLSQYEATLTLPILGHIHVTTIALLELGILFPVVGVIVMVILPLSGGRS